MVGIRGGTLIRGFVLGGTATVVGGFLGKGQHGCIQAGKGDRRWRRPAPGARFRATATTIPLPYLIFIDIGGASPVGPRPGERKSSAIVLGGRLRLALLQLLLVMVRVIAPRAA